MNTPDSVLLEAVAQAFGASARVESLGDPMADASTRYYQRAVLSDAPEASVVAMRFAPEDVTRSDEANTGETPARMPFLEVQGEAQHRGVRVPRVFADLSRKGCVLLEDLGDDTLFKVLQRTPREEWMPYYERAVDLLAAWQRAFPCTGEDRGLVYSRSFDRKLIRWELDHFREWGLEAWRALKGDARLSALEGDFDALADAVAAMPRVVMHRDWQSKNLMLRRGEFVVIDFQDALVGPEPYDLVALLCDSYTSLTLEEQRTLIARHCANAGVDDRAAYEHRFWTQAAQRKLKDAGRFVYIDRVRKNASFLQYIPQSVAYADRALSLLPERSALREKLRALAPDWFG